MTQYVYQLWDLAQKVRLDQGLFSSPEAAQAEANAQCLLVAWVGPDEKGVFRGFFLGTSRRLAEVEDVDLVEALAETEQEVKLVPAYRIERREVQ